MNTLLPKSELNLSSSSIEDSLNSILNHIRQIDKNVEERQRKELQEINLSYKNIDERMIKINKWIKRTNGNLPPSQQAEFNQIQITNKYLEKRLKNIDKEIDEYRKEQTDYYSIEIESEVERIKYTLTDYLGMVIPFEISHYYQMVKFESDLLEKIQVIDSIPIPEEPVKNEGHPKVGCAFLLTFVALFLPCFLLLCIPFILIEAIIGKGLPPYLMGLVFIGACFLSWYFDRKIYQRTNVKSYEQEKRNWEIQVENLNIEKRKVREETVQKFELVHSCLERYRQGDTSIIEDFICTTLEQLPRVRQGSSVISVNFSNSSVVVDYLLPDIDDIRELPIDVTIKQGDFSFSYFKDSQLSKAYNKLVYDIILAVMNCVFNYDEVEDIESVTVNGILDTVDKSIGKPIRICACSLQMSREEFNELNLELIDSHECFRRFKGVAAANIADKVAVRPIQQIQDKDRRFVEGYCVASELQRGTNLATMPWQDFENLIRELFEKLFSKHGGSCKVTRASRDGGVDAVAFNPDPISGGKFIIQAKRYTNLVSPSAVRDLYGTLQHEGANKAILVTTSDYGGDSYSFAKDKPIQLLNGSHLLHYLKEELGMTDVYINLEEAKKLNKEN